MKNNKVAIIIIVALLCVVCLLLGIIALTTSGDDTVGTTTTTTTTSKKTTTTTQDNDVSTEEKLELLSETISNEVDAKISTLEQEWETLKSSISNYNDYVNELDAIEAFYEKIINTIEALSVDFYKYALQYGDIIMECEDSCYDKYDYFDELYDNIYDDAADEIYDRIYDDLLKDMYDTFYDGVIKDAYESISYDEYYNYRSDEYDRYSDTRYDVYDMYVDTRSDIYEFYVDIRSELFAGDEDGARKELEKFRKNVEKLQ